MPHSVGAALNVLSWFHRRSARLQIVTLILSATVNGLNAQPIARPGDISKPKFEVALVKPCKDRSEPGAKGGGGVSGTTPGRITLRCLTVRSLILHAYVAFGDGHFHLPLFPSEIRGGASWTDSERYDISAKAEGNATGEMMQGPMLQALLEDASS